MIPEPASPSESDPGNEIEAEGDWIARQFIAPAELGLAPEEYVECHAHALGAFSFHFDRFQDSTLAAWVRPVGQLLASPLEVERCREQFLSADEREFAGQQDRANF